MTGAKNDKDTLLAQLLDERAIGQLINRWALSLDRHDWLGAENCLAEEFTLLAPPVITAAKPVPRKEAVTSIAERNGRWGGFHGLFAQFIELEGDTAKVTARIIGAHWTLDKARWEVGLGFQEIGCIRQYGDWRISSVSLDLRFSHGPGVLQVMAEAEGN